MLLSSFENVEPKTKPMRALIIPLFLVIGISLYYSCSKTPEPPDDGSPSDKPSDKPDDEDPIPEQTLILSFRGGSSGESSNLKIENDKSAILFVIEAQPNWTATADDDWIQLASYKGSSGKMGLIAGFEKNTLLPRASKIKFKAGSVNHTIHVEQSGAPEISFTVDDVNFSMRQVKGGSFLMGDSDIPESRWAHSVTLDDYYICTTEVTNALWETVTGYLPYDKLDDPDGIFNNELPSHPVSAVSWTEINEVFLPSISRLTGFSMELPSEAEWEYAATGGINHDSFNYSGSSILNEVAWHFSNCWGKQPVGKLKPNSLGIYDMSGNVSEWCADWYQDGYDSVDGVINPKGPSSGTERVVRGGNYFNTANFDKNSFYVKARRSTIPGCYNGCWGNTGHPDEPVCFSCYNIGFRFVLKY